MDEALELTDYLPVSLAAANEQEYLQFLWAAFETNYEQGRYEFASLAFHLLYMSFVSFSIWQIRLARPEAFHMAMVGFRPEDESAITDCDSPFKFYEKLREAQIFRFLKLIGCTNAQVGEFAKFVRRRNKIAHPTGTVFFNDQQAIDQEISAMMREVRNIEAHSGSLTGGFLTFLGDISGWFGARGVERITFISSRSDEEGSEGFGPDIPRGGRDGGEGEITAKWSAADESPAVRQSKRISFPQGLVIQHMSANSALELKPAGGMLDWILVPYAHRPSDARFDAFRRAMHRKFGSQYQSKAVLVRMLHDHKKLDALREAYELIWSDHNLVSMALYAGPLSANGWDGYSFSDHGDIWHRPIERHVVGWLLTGDFHLGSGLRRKAFLGHYRAFLDYVNVFGLPHHGSHRSFDPSLPGAMPNLSQCVAAAGPNGYGHPHEIVIDTVQSAGRQFVHVTNSGRTVLQWRHTR